MVQPTERWMDTWVEALAEAGFDIERDGATINGRRERASGVDTIALDGTGYVLLRSTSEIELPRMSQAQLGDGEVSIIRETVRTVSVRWRRTSSISPRTALAGLERLARQVAAGGPREQS